MRARITILAAAATMAACATQQRETMIGNGLTDAEIATGRFTPEVMWKMNRIGSSSVSPDGRRVVYAVTRYDMAENRGRTNLWLTDLETGDSRRLTDHDGRDTDPAWNDDGTFVRFLSDRGGSTQAWRIGLGDDAAVQLSDIPDGIDGFGFAPGSAHAYYLKRVPVEKRRSSDIYPDLPHSNARIYDDLMARHWNTWDDGAYLHIFVAATDREGRIGEGADIMPDEAWDAPTAPYFDGSEIAWNHAGTQLAYTCKKLTGTAYAQSTDSNIFLYDIPSAKTTNLTAGMPGYDRYPVFSPDDRRLAFSSMRTAGYESDRDRLFVLDLASGEKRELTDGFPHSAMNVVWADSARLWFIAPVEATLQVCRAGLHEPAEIVTSGDHDINRITSGGGRIVAEITSLSRATELYTLDPAAGTLARLTDVNREIYDHVAMGAVEKRMVATTDGKQMLTWVVFPPGFDPAKKYPVLLYCQGGPQSVVSQFWSYRWNLQLMASQGYVVVAPNRRGVPSFGQEWLEQISGDYGGQNIRDLLSAIDDAAREPWADADRMGCVGASYGGYSSFYLAGNHDGRFKAFIAHCGIFNFESMYGETEELFFMNHDYGGPYWEKNNPTAQRTYARSPHRFVDRWDTPMLIVTGQNDYRIPYTQSLEAFTAARVLGVPARLVFFEDEAHQVFKPQNSLVWNREFFGWLGKYLK